MNVDKVHLRHIMLYEFRSGVTVAEAVRNLRKVYKDQAPSKRTVEKWFARFRRGEIHLEDKSRTGRPSDIDDDAVRALVQNNPRISTEEVAAALKVDQSTAFRHLKKIGYNLT